MTLTLEEWEEKKKKLPQTVKDKIQKRGLKNFNNDIEKWNNFKIESPENYVFAEFSHYQELLVEELMSQYDINIPNKLMEDFIWAMSWDEESAQEVYLTPDYELAKLVDFLRQSFENDSNIVITSTIKGIKKKIEINHETNLAHLYNLCDSLLYSNRNYAYVEKFDLKEKENYYSLHKDDVRGELTHADGTKEILYNNKINIFSGTVDPYTEEELKKII